MTHVHYIQPEEERKKATYVLLGALIGAASGGTIGAVAGSAIGLLLAKSEEGNP